jgi:hypothetical protein
MLGSGRARRGEVSVDMSHPLREREVRTSCKSWCATCRAAERTRPVGRPACVSHPPPPWLPTWHVFWAYHVCAFLGCGRRGSPSMDVDGLCERLERLELQWGEPVNARSTVWKATNRGTHRDVEMAAHDWPCLRLNSQCGY